MGTAGTGSADPLDGSGADRRAGPVVVRPSRGVATATGVVAVGSVAAAVAGVAVGEGVLGVVALVSAAWLGSLAWTSWRASSVADRDGVEVVWLGGRRQIAWDDVEAVVIDGVTAGGTLGSTTLVVRSGAHLRWAPWYPFLWFTHRSVHRSVARLSALAASLGVEVDDVADTAGPAEGHGAGRSAPEGSAS